MSEIFHILTGYVASLRFDFTLLMAVLSAVGFTSAISQFVKWVRERSDVSITIKMGRTGASVKVGNLSRGNIAAIVDAISREEGLDDKDKLVISITDDLTQKLLETLSDVDKSNPKATK